jgi:uncharacterized protein (TIGR00288 family)
MSDAGITTNATMAVFLDLENIVLGARDANFPRFNIKIVFERLLARGHIVTKKAYCDFDRYKDFKRDLHEAAFELIEIPHVRQSGKNSADIRMVVDALDLCYTKTHIDTFVILSGDSDFSPLVSKLRENGKKVIGVGVKNSSSDLFIENCDEFFYYDDFVRRVSKPRAAKPVSKAPATKATQEGPTKEQAFEQLISTTEVLMEERDEDRIYGSVIKPAMKRLNPGFSERAHGFASFNELLNAAKEAGLVELEMEGKSRNFLVRLTRPA